MNRTKEHELEELIWISLQAITVANRASIGTEYHQEVSKLRQSVSDLWDSLSTVVKAQLKERMEQR